MCGFVAIVSRDAPVDVREALHALRHRGPDGEGIWRSADGRVALGHVRLAIVDATGGAQPIANEDKTIHVVASGEIYDYATLRADLVARGHRFRTRSDSELLVHLYEEHGDACVEKVRGELAFVLWDERRQRLLAGRDRFGIRPLVWAEHDGAIVLASEAKALFAAGVRARWDAEAFFVAASVQYVPPDRTLFAGVRTLPPGAILTVEKGRAAVRRYWDLDYPREGEANGDAAQVRALLEDAVAVRADAEVPVAFQLSGGLDSTAVLALAARRLAYRPQAFTLAFDDAAYDERAVAAASADAIGADLHVIDANASALADALPSAIAHGEGLVINAHASAKWLLSRAIARAGFKVALSGEGSDEVFAGYAHLRRDLGVTATETTNAVSVGTMLPNGETLPLDAARRALGFVPSFLEAKAALGRRVHALFAEPFAREVADHDGVARCLGAFDVGGQLAGRSRVHVALHLWTRLALATYILRTLGDGMDLAHAVEVRLPFLDHHVFEHARTLPDAALFGAQDGRVVEKRALRDALVGVVPEGVRTREKHPLLAPPLATAGAGRGRELAGDVLARCAAPFFDRAAVQRLFERVPRMTSQERVVTEPVLMTVLSACILHESWGLG